jgi:GPI mannosyltransferase 3
LTTTGGLITKADGAAATPAAALRRALPVAALASVVLIAVALRLVPTVLQPSMNWGDEIFQTIEPAHRLVYGYGLVTWEFRVGMRSWLLPGTIAGLIEIARVFGDGPQYYLRTIAMALGVLGAAPVVCSYLWCRRDGSVAGAVVAAAAVAVAPELVYFGARALDEVVAAHVFVIALYLTAPGYRVGARRQFAAGALFGLVCLLRLQLAPAAALVALWPVRGERRHRFLALVAGGTTALACGAALDWVTLGYPLASVWRNLYYNLYLGVSSGFSVEPWWFYLVGELGVWLAAAPLVLLLVGLGARRQPLLFAAALLIVAVHSAIPHKEYRFIYPAVVLLMLLAASGLAQLTAAAAQWLQRRDMRPAVAAALAAVTLIAAWSAAASAAWSGGTLALLRLRAHDELLAIAYARDLPDLCGVGLYGKNAWVRYGGYSHLHRRVPVFWPASEAELRATAGGFDALLYDRRDKAPRASLAYRRLRCFGPICIARRSGPCVAMPPSPMWLPRALRGRLSATVSAARPRLR